MRFHIKEKKHQDEIKRLVQSKDIDRMFKGKRHDVHFNMVRPYKQLNQGRCISQQPCEFIDYFNASIGHMCTELS